MYFLNRRFQRRSACWTAAAAAAGTLVLSLTGYAAPAGASTAASPSRGPEAPGAVDPTPAPGTPALLHESGRSGDNIRQIVQCGSTMFAVGEFSQVTQNGEIYTRSNIFSFAAGSPYTLTSWAPDVNGIVNSITFNGDDCADAYIGGDFTSVNGTTVEDIAEIDTTTGDVVPAFGTSSAGGPIETLLGVDGHILVGGYFSWINGSHDSYMASVSPVTGKDDGFLRLDISGHYDYCGAGECTEGTQSYVYNQQLSHDGEYDLVEGDFTSVGGLQREQIFMLDLATDPATVTAWTSPQWDGSDPEEPYQCWPDEAFYIRAAAWSPDDSTVYIATTGFYAVDGSTSGQRTGLCDAAAAFPATMESVTDLWINYTGCDSLYSAAADDGAVYVAGHQRFSENSDGCNGQGPGSTKDFGLWGLNPSNGQLEVRPDGAPVYSMSRANADDMLLTSAGLWIASSNRYGAQYCDGKAGHTGICFLPYPPA